MMSMKPVPVFGGMKELMQCYCGSYPRKCIIVVFLGVNNYDNNEVDRRHSTIKIFYSNIFF